MNIKARNVFLRYLKDDKFIEWKLLPSEKTELYWKEFIKEHPDEEANINLAEKRLRKICNPGIELSQTKKDEILEQLEKSLSSHYRKRKLRNLIYIAAASVSILLISVLYLHQDRRKTEIETAASANYIIGNELESQDILFTTGNTTSSFKENINIEIQKGNKAKIKSNNINESDITIAENTINKLVVPYGKQLRLVLPDGTKVWLNSGTTLEFPSDFESKIVKVKLTGEMYVEVIPDSERLFVVNTPDFDVRVYGTKFNVTSYKESLPSVVLVEGSVGVKSGKNSEIVMLPSQQATLLKEGVFDTKNVDTNLFTSWKEGYLTFNDTPIIDALKQIERYYNLSFDFDTNISFSGITCTGKIILSDNLDNVLTALSLISSTSFKRDNNSIYIYNDN